MNDNSDEERLAAAIRDILDKPVVMTGMMGAGKSRIGSMLAMKLSLPFMDSDREIEKAAGCTIAEIFERDGEDFFREVEHRIITRLIDNGVKVLSVGGGAITNPETERLIRKNALSVWLRADIDILVKRTSGSANRPLLTGRDSAEVLRSLAVKREPAYSRADIIVDSLDVPQKTTLYSVLRKLHEYLHKN
jgi:shikimate kinase